MRVKDQAIIALDTFIVATRESGYRDFAAAVAELIDNSIQAQASRISVIAQSPSDAGGTSISVLDNGSGMDAAGLQNALRFGGTNRFDDRSGLGRFGMGLPNSSVSQSRRLDVYSWQKPNRVLHTYLDVNEIASGRMRDIPFPRPQALPTWARIESIKGSGTLVVWSDCDRLGVARLSTVTERLRRALGRVYRTYLWSGTEIRVNGEPVTPIDPLFISRVSLVHGARAYGSPLKYQVTTAQGATSTIEVRFSELPLRRWSGWSDEDKRRSSIVGGAGVSILRAGREIDYGWFFMGAKRRENYDDWWRCELRFSPELDELFGVTNSKQGINPGHAVVALLSADLEPIARSLNARVRKAFQSSRRQSSTSVRAVSRIDRLLPPLAQRNRVSADGLTYRLENRPIAGPEFYAVRLRGGIITVTVNTDHPFFEHAYERTQRRVGDPYVVERLLLAAARADLEATTTREKQYVARIRRAWSDALAAFLEAR